MKLFTFATSPYARKVAVSPTNSKVRMGVFIGAIAGWNGRSATDS